MSGPGEKSGRMRFAGFLIAGWLVFQGAVVTPAQASAFCEIKATKDGFVALRAAPAADARLLQRMKPGDEILLGQERKGPWVSVTYWRGGRFASGRNPEGDPATATGWMHSGLIAKDSCG